MSCLHTSPVATSAVDVSAARERIGAARGRQAERVRRGLVSSCVNGRMNELEVSILPLAEAAKRLDDALPDRLARRLSTRRVAVTLADLEGAERVEAYHLEEAIELARGP